MYLIYKNEIVKKRGIFGKREWRIVNYTFEYRWECRYGWIKRWNGTGLTNDGYSETSNCVATVFGPPQMKLKFNFGLSGDASPGWNVFIANYRNKITFRGNFINLPTPFSALFSILLCYKRLEKPMHCNWLVLNIDTYQNDPISTTLK